MIVKELIERLKDVPQDYAVVVDEYGGDNEVTVCDENKVVYITSFCAEY